LNRPQLRVIADMRNGSADTVDEIDEKLARRRFLTDAVNFYIRHNIRLHVGRLKTTSRPL